jgi:hypothetical protein
MLACHELDKIAIFSYVTVDTHPQLSPNHALTICQFTNKTIRSMETAKFDMFIKEPFARNNL